MKSTQKSGFTIVELLIVIVVIAILAAVTVVAYNGIQAKAYTSKGTSVVDELLKKIELYKVDAGSYPETGGEFVCVGSVSDYPADGVFSAGECISDGTYVSAQLNSALAPYNIQNLNPQLPSVDFGGLKYRGIQYKTYSEYIAVNFVINGTQDCPRGYTEHLDGATGCYIEFVRDDIPAQPLVD